MSVLKTITDYRMLLVLILSIPVTAHARVFFTVKTLKTKRHDFSKKLV